LVKADSEFRLESGEREFQSLISGFYKRLTDLKTSNKKVLLGLGGWVDSETDKFSKLVSNPTSRSKFITHSIDFLKQNNFDGLDLDWEYPKCWQVFHIFN